MSSGDEIRKINRSAFGPLPPIPRDKVLYLLHADWERLESLIVAALIQACVDEGRWQIVEMDLLLRTLKRYPEDGDTTASFWRAFKVLQKRGSIERFEWDGKEYIELLPDTVAVARQGRWEYRQSTSPRQGGSLMDRLRQLVSPRP